MCFTIDNLDHYLLSLSEMLQVKSSRKIAFSIPLFP